MFISAAAISLNTEESSQKNIHPAQVSLNTWGKITPLKTDALELQKTKTKSPLNLKKLLPFTIALAMISILSTTKAFNNKKSQIVVFIILFVFLLALAFFMFYAKGMTQGDIEKGVKAATKLSDTTGPVNSYAKSCLIFVTNRTLLLDKLGLQGGFLFPKEITDIEDTSGVIFTSMYNTNIPLYNNGSSPPSLNEIEEKLERHLITEFQKCLDLDVFRKEGMLVEEPDYNPETDGYNFSELNISSEVNINMKDISIILDYPITIKKGKLQKTLSNFSVVIPIEIPEIYYSAIKIATIANTLISQQIIPSPPDLFYNISENCDLFNSEDNQTNIRTRWRPNIDDPNDPKSYTIIEFQRYNEYIGMPPIFIYRFAIRGINIEASCSS